MNKIVMRKAITLYQDNAVGIKAAGIIVFVIAFFAFALPSEGQTVSNKDSSLSQQIQPVQKEKPGQPIIIKLLGNPGVTLRVENNSTFITNPPSAVPANENNGVEKNHSGYAQAQSENFADSPWIVWVLLMTAVLALLIGLIIGLLYKMRNNNGNGFGEMEHFGTVQHEHNHRHTGTVTVNDKKEIPSPH